MANRHFQDTPSVPTTILDAPPLTVLVPSAGAAPRARKWLSLDHPWRMVVAIAVPFWCALAAVRIVMFELTTMSAKGVVLLPWTVRSLQNLLVMLLALLCYRIALHIGWPDRGRLRAALLHIGLALVVALPARPILLSLGIPFVPPEPTWPDTIPMTAWMWIEWLMMNLVGSDFGRRFWFTTSLDFMMSYFFGLALLLGVRATLALRDAELERAELQNAWMQSRLQALRMQLNPHFLFNALNTVATMLDRRPGEARALVVSLSHLLRRALDTADSEWATLSEEADFADRYLEIQAARFEGRLNYEIRIDPVLARARLPAMILQPLVENAVLHGVGDDRDRLRVWVTARTVNDDLEIEIGNETTGLLDPVSSTEGVGLGNTRSRLAVCYGDRASLSLSRPSIASCIARLRLPLEIVGTR